jgi:deoxyuridine 5'-triphosphate nucleotidohydrolase
MIFTRTRDVIQPKRANPFDAGIDFYVPAYTDEFASIVAEKSNLDAETIMKDQNIKLKPGESCLVPLGVKVIVDQGEALVAFNKSGIASKKSLLVGSAVVDFGYEGEVHLNLHNVSDQVQTIDFDSKIIQFLQLKIDTRQPTEVATEEYETIARREFDKDSSRGAGGFGSTGN